MIDRSVSYIRLAQAGQAALGQTSNSLSQPFSLETLIKIDAANWTPLAGANAVWKQDFQPEALKVATLTHAEMAADRFLRQMSTLLRGLSAREDPHWTAVTTYYAAFYAAQALLLQIGHGAIRVSSIPNLPFKGIFNISSAPSSTAAGMVSLNLTALGKGGSHRITWVAVEKTLMGLVAAETDPRAAIVLKTLMNEVSKPTYLSDARNEINYDLTSSPYSQSFWPSLLLDLSTPEELEDELARSKQTRTERRFEIVALALGCLAAQIRVEFLDRGGRLDARQRAARRKELPQRPWLW